MGSGGKDEEPKHPDRAHDAYRAVVRAADHLTGAFDALFKDHGLTRTQFDVLTILCRADEPLPAVSIARALHTRDPDITRLLERLSSSGLVHRERSRLDRRVTLNRLTDRGEAVLGTLNEPVRELHERQFEHFAAGEVETLLTLASRTIDGAG